ncbi:MAG: 30S ribosomal protein S6 [Gloeocapsa sp. DLM2.Bin57]|nr:MAG: 30S ribosomal protein S6 [Gloeocapsa sp. DLM2.Bin57]
MTQAYEMMYILRPNLLEEQINEAVTKYRNLLTEHGATDIKVKFWGRRRLAYPIAKHQEGVYILMYYQADGQQVAVLERAMRLSEEVIRYLTIKLKEVPELSEDSFQELPKASIQPREVPVEVPVEDEQPPQPEVIADEVPTLVEDEDEQPSQPEVIEA